MSNTENTRLLERAYEELEYKAEKALLGALELLPKINGNADASVAFRSLLATAQEAVDLLHHSNLDDYIYANWQVFEGDDQDADE